MNLTPKEAAKMLGRLGGLAKSKKKAQAARKNGKRGGRPVTKSNANNRVSS